MRQMWTEANHFKARYGPGGATIPLAKMDVRVGGTRLVCMEMETPGGPMKMWFTGEYREVVPASEVVHDEAVPPRSGGAPGCGIQCLSQRSAPTRPPALPPSGLSHLRAFLTSGRPCLRRRVHQRCQ
jgi:uncharacterized protein YndB with AHSA1/START domain